MQVTPQLQASMRPALAPRRVLVATSLGSPATCSLRVALARAAGWGAELAICHVGESAIECAVFADRGDVAVAVARRAAAWGADLLIVGGTKSCEGKVSRFWNSRVGWDIVQLSPCPVLITRHTPATGRMVVGTDLTTASAPAVRAAALEQARTGAQATLVHCVAPGDHRGDGEGVERGRQLESVARGAGLRALARVVTAPTGVGLVAVAAELAADLVVVGGGSRGRGGVAARVAREAACAVLVVV
jgi:nucleotide-binding universal stress UspA family protein